MLTRPVFPWIRVAAVLGLAVAVAFAWVCAHYQGRIADLSAALSAQQETALGPNWSRVKRSRDLAATVPGLAEQLLAAKKAGVRIVIAGHAKSGKTAFEDRRPPSPAAPEEAGVSSTPPAPPPILVTGETQVAVGLKADGTLKATWKMWATLYQNGEQEGQRLELRDVHGEITVDPKLEAALKALANPAPRFTLAPRSIRLWRAGWFVGPGLVIRTDGRVSAGIVVGWGLQF